jgi:hypothetical protein
METAGCAHLPWRIDRDHHGGGSGQKVTLATEKRKLYLSEWSSGQGTDTCTKWECVIIFPPLIVRDSFAVRSMLVVKLSSISKNKIIIVLGHSTFNALTITLTVAMMTPTFSKGGRRYVPISRSRRAGESAH